MLEKHIEPEVGRAGLNHGLGGWVVGEAIRRAATKVRHVDAGLARHEGLEGERDLRAVGVNGDLGILVLGQDSHIECVHARNLGVFELEQACDVVFAEV